MIARRRFIPFFLSFRRSLPWRRVRSPLSWRRLCWTLFIASFLTLTAVGALNLIKTPSTLTVIEGKTEYLHYRSFNPQLSSFSVNGFRVAFADNPSMDGNCLKGTLVPQADSSIVYTKRYGHPLTVALDRGSELRVGGNVTRIDGQIGLFSDPSCGELEVRKLPVWGPGQIGDAFTVRQDGIGPVLLSGSLSVFGRTLDLGWFGKGGALYAATAQPLALR